MADLLGYEGKRVIVTGCFSGMGYETARYLLSLGAEVHGFDYKDCTLDLASFRNVDLRDPSSIDAGLAAVGGKVYALFNCAGLPHSFPPVDVMKVNLIGTRHLTARTVTMMDEGSAIASISSNGGLGWSRRLPAIRELLAIDDFAAAAQWCENNPASIREGYSFSKEALIVWTLLTSQTLIKRGIRINCILPGPTQSPMMAAFETVATPEMLDFVAQPIGRRARPAEQAAAMVLLNSTAASYINGVALPVDGGFVAGLTSGEIVMPGLHPAGEGH